MKKTVSLKTLKYMLFVFFMGCGSFCGFRILNTDVVGLKHAILLEFAVFILLFVYMGRINKCYLTLYSVFLIAFYLFQNGQLLLYALNVDYNYFYVLKHSLDSVFLSVEFSTYCLCAAFAAGIFSFKPKRYSKISRNINSFSVEEMFLYARVGLIITGTVAWLLVVIKFIIVRSSGYQAVRLFESNVPSVIGLVENLFPAFAVLCIICNEKKNHITLLFLIWGIITSLTGDRTTGIGIIVIIAFMYYKSNYSKSISAKMKKNIIMLGSIILTMFMISFALSFRSNKVFTIESIAEGSISVIGELGFSFFPLVGMIQICPQYEPFLYGKSMISSLIVGFFPQSLDVFGVLDSVADTAELPLDMIAKRYQYGFGMDCSLNAECYANFGICGFIAMFMICAVVAYMLHNVNYSRRDNLFTQYTGVALLFSWFTLPRRRSYYIYSKIFWYILIMMAFLLMMNKLLRKRKGR